jgi:hypothetical protein
MTLPSWQLEDDPTIFSLTPASETRGGMKEGRSKRGIAADLARVNEVYVETTPHLNGTLLF